MSAWKYAVRSGEPQGLLPISGSRRETGWPRSAGVRGRPQYRWPSGLAVTAIELGPQLAAIARRRLAVLPAALVVTCSFEDWPLAAAMFDAVVAVNSLHWIDPQL